MGNGFSFARARRKIFHKSTAADDGNQRMMARLNGFQCGLRLALGLGPEYFAFSFHQRSHKD